MLTLHRWYFRVKDLASVGVDTSGASRYIVTNGFSEHEHKKDDNDEAHPERQLGYEKELCEE